MSWRKKTSQVCLPDKFETSTTFPVPKEPRHQVSLTRYQFFLNVSEKSLSQEILPRIKNFRIQGG